MGAKVAIRKWSRRSRYKLVLVKWVDSAYANGWVDCDGWGAKAAKCVSAGWLIEDRKKSVIISAHITDPGGPNESIHAPMAIPRASIITMRIMGRRRACD